MKNVFHGGQNRGAGFTERLLLALLMVFCLIITVPFLSNAAERPDIDKSCSLTVRGANAEKLPEDLAKAGIVLDLYQVASAVDGYSFQKIAPFEALELGNNMNAGAWSAATQQAAEIVLGGNAAGAVPVKEGIAIGTKITDLKPGLYFLVARGQGIENYVDKNKDGEYITRAYSKEYSYTFSPELVALPGMAPEVDKWIYDMEIVLKMEWTKDEAYGAIQIVKTLEGYNENNGPATFVFDVEAELNGRNVYSNVVTIVFTGSGDKKLLVERIPVGATVTVTEVYSGACYSLVTPKSRTVTVETDKDIVSVSFKNRYDDRPNDGHSITNHFKRGEDGWKLEQKYDRSQG